VQIDICLQGTVRVQSRSVLGDTDIVGAVAQLATCWIAAALLLHSDAEYHVHDVWLLVSASYVCLCFSYCNLLQFITGDIQKSSLSQLMIFLCHTYPIVRKTTATKLYEAILTYPGVTPDECIDDMMSLLVETDW